MNFLFIIYFLCWGIRLQIVGVREKGGYQGDSLWQPSGIENVA